jgi:hypothetical protein
VHDVLWTILLLVLPLVVTMIAVAVVVVVVVHAVRVVQAVLVVVDVVLAAKAAGTLDPVRLLLVEVSNLCWLLSASNTDACIVDTDEELPPVVHVLTSASLDYKHLSPAG